MRIGIFSIMCHLSLALQKNYVYVVFSSLLILLSLFDPKPAHTLSTNTHILFFIRKKSLKIVVKGRFSSCNRSPAASTNSHVRRLEAK